ncbi:ComEA family DNA-binding protein [Flavihumibacter sp. UBA7668]|uniref:ComEA family DNA-binding protein n=1 Tax=Flavihumibacter sp. UBA7668 TaxID=1946542 RepID=UPI0025C05118|nr:helix-hairpin-helix domain-containing protein [Flavihumibacter sp. UBA7668]
MKNTSIKQWLKEYLHFSRKERIAVLGLIAGILLIKLVPQYWQTATPAPIPVPDSLIAKLLKQNVTDSNRIARSWNRAFENNRQNYSGEKSYSARKAFPERNYPRPSYVDSKEEEFRTIQLFEFNPNTASADDWKLLGLNPKLIRTILNFREKGGRFRTSEDLGKIYGMPSELVVRLQPFVVIEKSSNVQFKRNQSELPIITASSALPKPETKALLINAADSLDWLSLPGIGPKLTSRILQFRKQLGGFVAVSQLGEVYGLQDSVYQLILPYLRLDEKPIELIHINMATQEELSRHPYIRWKLAQAIIQYRTRNGAFRDISDLSKIHLINPDLLKKLAPYCQF